MTQFEKIGHTVLVGILVYAILIFMLRISGKRTLSKWNSFDFIVTVAFGSTLASTLLNRNVTLLQSMTAFALLIGLQFAITFISVRSTFFEKLVKSKPTLLLYKGHFIESKLRQQRISKSEVLAAIRNNGFASLDSVGAVVLETDGSLSVIRLSDGLESASALKDIDHAGRLDELVYPPAASMAD